MKHFNIQSIRKLLSPCILMFVLPCTLIIPNIILDITDYSNLLERTTNVVLPLGIYLWLMSSSRNTGRTTLLMFPFIFYAAFQIVLLYLYGGSIIAIDMFLNVVTTNVGEATELLGNLSLAIVTVIILYLTPIIWAIILICRKQQSTDSARAIAKKYGILCIIIGLVSTIAAYIFTPTYSFSRKVFPANVINNTITAAVRIQKTADYPNTSADFNFNAVSNRDSTLREVYVLIIGETARTDNWQLFGYDRATNPLLSKRDSLLIFDKALSQSNTTHKSVPLLLTCINPEIFNDSIYTTKSIITAFKEAGFSTAFFSNQARNHSFIDYFAEEADYTVFIRDDGHHHKDSELVTLLHKFISTNNNKSLIILHTYGSHFNYKDRFDSSSAIFTPYEKADAAAENRAQLINAYDNTIVMTDKLIDDVISSLDKLNCPSAMLYLSDHGEDIFDDNRGRFLHASPVPTYYQIHVPVLIWLSQELNEINRSLYDNASRYIHNNIASNDIVFHTIMDMANVSSTYCDSTRSLVNSNYIDRPRIYLNDYNESTPLSSAGLHEYDCVKLNQKQISFE